MGGFLNYLYILFLIAVGGGFLAVRLLMPKSGPTEAGTSAFDYRDPYLIAALRGGAGAATELAVVALLDRGLLRSSEAVFNEEARVVVSRADAADFASNDVERTLLRCAASPVGVRDIVTQDSVVAAAEVYAERLAKLGLKGDRADSQRRLRFVVNCFLPAIFVVIVLAMLAEKHWGLFIGLGVIVIAPSIYLARRMGEAPGEAMLRELGDLFAGLRIRTTDFRRGRMCNEAMFCAATFGLSHLPAAEYPAAAFYSAEEHRRRQSDSGGGSSCGSGGCGSSSDGNGGGGGDGGGGGCGGGCGGGG